MNAELCEIGAAEGRWEIVTFLGLNPAGLNLVTTRRGLVLEADGEAGMLSRSEPTQVGAAIAVPVGALL